MIERDISLGAMAVALDEETRRQNDRAGASGAVAYAPPAVRRAHEAAQREKGNGQAPGLDSEEMDRASWGLTPTGVPQLEWPATTIPRPELEPQPNTPAVVHEAATDLAHVFEACAVEVERERDRLITETERVAQEATDTAAQIRALGGRAVKALHEQTQSARSTSAVVTEAMKKLRSGSQLQTSEG